MLAIVNFIIVGLIVVGAIMGSSGSGFGISTGTSFAAAALSAVIAAIIYLGYFTYMESSRGQTIGKMIMKLHVEGTNGGHPDMNEALKRNIWMVLASSGSCRSSVA